MLALCHVFFIASVAELEQSLGEPSSWGFDLKVRSEHAFEVQTVSFFPVIVFAKIIIRSFHN